MVYKKRRLVLKGALGLAAYTVSAPLSLAAITKSEPYQKLLMDKLSGPDFLTTEQIKNVVANARQCGSKPFMMHMHPDATKEFSKALWGEARYVLSKPRPWRKQFLANIEKRRGKEALKTLKDAIMVEFKK